MVDPENQEWPRVPAGHHERLPNHGAGSSAGGVVGTGAQPHIHCLSGIEPGPGQGVRAGRGVEAPRRIPAVAFGWTAAVDLPVPRS